MKINVQYPKAPNTWLYQDQEDGTRNFTDYIILGKEAEPWPECTDEEKATWETEHPEIIESNE